jgi:hypothetical protein
VDQDGSSGWVASDLTGLDPRLDQLRDNGGDTQTMALPPGSPAIAAGDNTDAPDYDQRGPGFPRIVGGTIDIGAFEVQPSPVSSLQTVRLPGVPPGGAEAQAGGGHSVMLELSPAARLQIACLAATSLMNGAADRETVAMSERPLPRHAVPLEVVDSRDQVFAKTWELCISIFTPDV